MSESVLSAVALGVGLFAAANLDDLFLLVAWFGARRSARQVIVGQFVGIAAILAASLAAAGVVATLAPTFARYLGLLPIAIGGWRLVGLRRGNGGREDMPDRPVLVVLAVALMTIADCGDDLGVLPPAFASRGVGDVAVIAAVFLAMTDVWCAIAYGLARHPAARRLLRRHDELLVALVLIAVGLAVLVSA